MHQIASRLLITTLLALPCAASLADDRPYTEGSVVDVSFIRTKPGMFDKYMKWLDTQRKQEMDELKKAGVIVSYGVFAVEPRSPHDPDVILTVTYKNMAALDDLDAKSDAIMKKVYGSLDAAEKGDADREAMREVVGSELIRELALK
jgi:hypothetical protein